ncbi:MAG: ankyrin repeat domain-containing protein [Rhodocyclales bacterium GT-UBC]|nr:MAG: ankyrin repeat domain-containing protein [Rhodocyclales bacterium GT-UBC]
MRLLLLLCSFMCLLNSPLRAQQSTGGEQPIHLAAREASGREVSRLLKADPAQRDARTAMGSTPLHLAAMNPDTSALSALIAAGADPNARDQDGSTPLHMAAYASRAEHARKLLEAGADPALKNNQGRDATAMARKVKADEAAGVISLWILKGCKPGKPC